MMREIKFKAWHLKEKKMYFRGYQKINHILLCEDDRGENEGKGVPVKRASYEECALLEATGVNDDKGIEIYEGDIVRVYGASCDFTGVLRGVPDMFKSRGLHPLQDLIDRSGCSDDPADLKFRIMGNEYENPEGVK